MRRSAQACFAWTKSIPRTNRQPTEIFVNSNTHYVALSTATIYGIKQLPKPVSLDRRQSNSEDG